MHPNHRLDCVALALAMDTSLPAKHVRSFIEIDSFPGVADLMLMGR